MLKDIAEVRVYLENRSKETHRHSDEKAFLVRLQGIAEEQFTYSRSIGWFVEFARRIALKPSEKRWVEAVIQDIRPTPEQWKQAFDESVKADGKFSSSSWYSDSYADFKSLLREHKADLMFDCLSDGKNFRGIRVQRNDINVIVPNKNEGGYDTINLIQSLWSDSSYNPPQ